MKQAAKPRLSFLQIWNMCVGLFGVQIVWGLQNANTSRIFQTLGADIDELAILWIAGPAAGLLVQPVIGYLSDRTWTPLGRRRPYLLGGAILTAIALFAMANASSLWLASLMLWILTASINIAMEPFRALVADTLPEEQRTTGFATQVFFIGAGAVFASALPWMLTQGFGLDGAGAPGHLPQSLRWAFYIGGAGLLTAVSWSVFTTPERRPDPAIRIAADPHPIPSAEGAAALVRQGLLWIVAGLALAGAAWWLGWEREIYVVAAMGCAFGLCQLAAVGLRRAGRESIGMLEIVEDILHMPLVLKRLAVVQFFTWFGLFTMWIYTTPAVAEYHYGATEVSPAYNIAADWVGVLFAGYNGVAAIAALLLPLLSARVGRPVAHALCLGVGALGLAGFLMTRQPGLLWLPAAAIGVAWAGILSLPYAMLSSAVPPAKTGVYMGIHNVFLVLPQLVAATVLGWLVRHAFEGHAIYALGLSAASLALGAVFSLTVPKGAGE